MKCPACSPPEDAKALKRDILGHKRYVLLLFLLEWQILKPQWEGAASSFVARSSLSQG